MNLNIRELTDRLFLVDKEKRLQKERDVLSAKVTRKKRIIALEAEISKLQKELIKND